MRLFGGKSTGPKAHVSFQHNVLPALCGVLAFVGILGLMNGQWLVAQADYRFAPKASAEPQFKHISTKAPNDNSELFIPSINVDAPLHTDISTYADWAVQIGLRTGVVHYGHTALPGQDGNIVIVGHSSEVPWAPGNYKFVFTLLNRMKPGEYIYIDYKGTRYTYKMTSSEVVDPTDFNIIQQTNDPELTLVTCTPVGTDWHRLVIHAVQISPNPKLAAPAPQVSSQSPSSPKLPQ